MKQNKEIHEIEEKSIRYCNAEGSLHIYGSEASENVRMGNQCGELYPPVGLRVYSLKSSLHLLAVEQLQ